MHTYTFLSLPKNTQKDILLLDESAKWESKYLDEEEILSNFLKNKKSLSNSEIEKLSDEIINSLSWDRIRDESRSKDISYFILSRYFAGYHIIEFAKKLADNLDIVYNDDEDLKEKVSRVVGLRKKLKDVIYEEIEDGLFLEEYIPLCNESGYETYSGETTLKLKDVFEIWLKEKDKTKKIFQEMIEEKEIIIEEKTETIIDFNITKKIITGNSLYRSNKKLPFISEYKKQVDSLSVYGFLYNLLEKENIPKKYGYILSHKEIVEQVSKIVGVKVTNTHEKYLKQIEDLVENTNLYLRVIDNNISDFIYENNDWNFPIETFFEKFRVDLKNTKPVKATPHKLFNKKAKELLKSEWSD